MSRVDGLTSAPRRPEIDRRQHTNDEMHRDRRRLQRTQGENHEGCSLGAGLALNEENPKCPSSVEGTI